MTSTTNIVKAKQSAVSVKSVKADDIKQSKRQAVNNFCQTLPHSRSLLDMQAAALGNKRNSIQGMQGPSDHVFEDFGGLPSSMEQYGFGGSTKNLVKVGNKTAAVFGESDSDVDIVLLDQEKLSLVCWIYIGNTEESKNEQKVIYSARGHQK